MSDAQAAAAAGAATGVGADADTAAAAGPKSDGGSTTDLTKQPPPLGRVGRNELGRIAVAARAVEKIASLAAVEIPDAGGAAGRLLGWRKSGMDRLPKVSADVDGELVFLDVELSVRWPAPVAKVAEAVRQHLYRQVAALVGLEVREVNIDVVELITEAATARVS
jgi:uncharacterized alkaline shock family protein YloU